MLENILRFALKQRYVVIAVALVMALVGAWAWTVLPIVAYPDVADTEVAIITKYNGRPAEEVEQQITIPIERALNAVPRVVSRRSRTIFGLSVVRLTFQEGTDDYFARQQVLEKLKEAELPDGAEPELGPLSTPVGEILRYVVESTTGTHSVAELRELHDWIITPKILQATGIADVVNFGGVVKQFNVIINPAQLERYHLTIQQLSDAVQANNESTGGNIIQFGASQLAIRTVGRITRREDIEKIVVSTQNGVPIFVRDVASVELGSLTPSGVLGYTDKRRLNSEGEPIDVDNGVQGIVLMRRGEIPSQVLISVKEKIEELNNGKLPEGVKIIIMYDRKDLVDSTLETVAHTLFEGVSIVIIVLVFFLGNVRAALAVALTIPLSLLFAFIVMNLTGIPANLLSLGAIDFGIIVDSAVVMVEAIMRHLGHASEEQRQKNVRGLIFNAANEVQRQIVFAVIIIICAYLPLFTLQRVEGKLFSPMAYTLSYAIGGSLLLALTIVPVLCSFLLAKKFSEWHNPIVAFLERSYRQAITLSLRRPIPFIVAAMVLIVWAIGISGRVGTEFLPELDEGGFNIRCVLPAGVSLATAREYPKIIREEISSFDEVKLLLSQLGRNDDGTDPFGPNRIETLVQLTPYSTWKSGKTKRELLKEIKMRLEARLPGALFSFSQPILDNVTEAVTGSAADLAVIASGDDVKKLRTVADSVLTVIRQIRGASESGIEQEGPQTQLVVQINREAAARYGINVRDIDATIELAIAGKQITQLYEGERRFGIALRYTPEERSTPDAIANMLILTASGLKIPMNQVAKVQLIEGQTVIAREDGRRQATVRTNIRERDQGSYVGEAQKAVEAAIKQKNIIIPEKYTLKWGGQFENLTRAKNRLVIVIPITLLVIYLVLFLLFDNSAKYAGIVMLNVPFALVGGVAALWLREINFSVSSGVGFVSLFGVAVMSGVLLISYINLLRFEKTHGLRQAVIDGAVTQFRPIMMMMSVALIGLIPAALATGIGSDVQRPLATVIVGGLVSALVLTLLVMPVMYYLIEARGVKKRQRALRKSEGS